MGALVACVAVAAVVLLVLGFRVYVITGGSMTGAIPRGALAIDRSVPVSSLGIGDVITFRPPETTSIVTHRIIAVDRMPSGSPVFRTKGDANEATDPWQFVLDRPAQAKCIAHIPYLGYAFAALSLRPVRAVLIAVPLLALVFSLFMSTWKGAGEIARRRRTGSAVTEHRGDEAPAFRRSTAVR
jgi:signal peptidase I